MTTENRLTRLLTYLLATTMVVVYLLTVIVSLSAPARALSILPVVVDVSWGSAAGYHGKIRAVDNIDQAWNRRQALIDGVHFSRDNSWRYVTIDHGQACNQRTNFRQSKSYIEGTYLTPNQQTEAGKHYCFRSTLVVDSTGQASDDRFADGHYHFFGVSDLIEFERPQVTAVTTNVADGNYPVQTVIPVWVHFSEPVTVDAQQPALGFNSHNPATTNYGTYITGSGSDRLLFHLTFDQADAPIADLEITKFGANVCAVIPGEVCLAVYAPIRDAAGNVLDYSLPEASKLLAANKDISVGQQSPNPPTPPTPPTPPIPPIKLPVTGASSLVGALTVGLIGAGGHHYFVARRSRKH